MWGRAAPPGGAFQYSQSCTCSLDAGSVSTVAAPHMPPTGQLYESWRRAENRDTRQKKRGTMSNTTPAAPPSATPLSGEAIRLMNYVDDVATTLRRVLALAPTLTAEERKRLSEYLKNSSPSADTVLEALAAK